MFQQLICDGAAAVALMLSAGTEIFHTKPNSAADTVLMSLRGLGRSKFPFDFTQSFSYKQVIGR